MITHVTKELKCPTCGNIMDRATCFHDSEAHPPKEGDISVCIKCADVMVFNKEGTMREATINDLLALDSSAQMHLELAQRAIRRLM
jgi:hypothetical protein